MYADSRTGRAGPARATDRDAHEPKFRPPDHARAAEGELVNCNSETERVTAELDKLRVSASKTANAPDPAETSRLELRYRELQETVEVLRVDLDRWENAYMDERSRREEQQAHAQRMETARKEAEERESQQRQAAAQDKLVARQLQQTLEELQLCVY